MNAAPQHWYDVMLRAELRDLLKEGKSSMLNDAALDAAADALVVHFNALIAQMQASSHCNPQKAQASHAQHRAEAVAAVMTNDASRQNADFIRFPGARIREERLRLGFKTQAAAAARFGVKRETWSRYETGKLEMGRAICERFVNAGADFGYIVTGIREQTA